MANKEKAEALLKLISEIKEEQSYEIMAALGGAPVTESSQFLNGPKFQELVELIQISDALDFIEEVLERELDR